MSDSPRPHHELWQLGVILVIVTICVAGHPWSTNPRRSPAILKRDHERTCGGPMARQPLTIGIEEEFQIVRADGELQAHIETLLASARPILGEDVKAEMLQSVVEVGTRICGNVAEAREEILRLRGTLAALLEP